MGKKWLTEIAMSFSHTGMSATGNAMPWIPFLVLHNYSALHPNRSCRLAWHNPGALSLCIGSWRQKKREGREVRFRPMTSTSSKPLGAKKGGVCKATPRHLDWTAVRGWKSGKDPESCLPFFFFSVFLRRDGNVTTRTANNPQAAEQSPSFLYVIGRDQDQP